MILLLEENERQKIVCNGYSIGGSTGRHWRCLKARRPETFPWGNGLERKLVSNTLNISMNKVDTSEVKTEIRTMGGSSGSNANDLRS